MKEIDLHKANLIEIADHVSKTGEATVLTSGGQPYVDVVPHVQQRRSRRPMREVMRELAQLRRQLPKGTFEEIQAEIAEGRH